MHLDTARPSQAHDPEVTRAGEELGDLASEVGLVPADLGVLDGEGRDATDPPRTVWDIADGDVGSAVGGVVGREAGVDAGLLDAGVAVEVDRAGEVRPRAAPAGGEALDGAPLARRPRHWQHPEARVWTSPAPRRRRRAGLSVPERVLAGRSADHHRRRGPAGQRIDGPLRRV